MEDKNKWWYEATYNNLVKSRLVCGTKKKKNDGFNKHHIIPKCVGGKDIESNYVLLTFREHIIAHMLLVRIYPNCNGLHYALLRMIQSSHSDRKENNYKLNSDGTIKSFSTNQFEEIRDKGLQHLREINTGKKQSKETKEKLSNSHLGMTYNDLTKQKLSEIRKGKHVKSKIHVEKNGTIYSSISECMDKLNIPRSQITEENGFIIKREESTRNRKVQGPDGTIYKNVNECHKITGYNKSTLMRWLKDKPEKGFKYL